MCDHCTVVGHHDIVLMTLDTLRYDAACMALKQGHTPHLASILPDGGWEERHSPGSFTWAAHWSFFAGFLPTPARPGRHARLFAARFLGSETTTAQTCVFDAPDIVHGLAGRGYHTVCIGGVGFFNKQTPVGSALPALFAESHWAPRLGVTDPDSTEHQFRLAAQILDAHAASKRVFLFINVSALHQPNRFYLEGCDCDTLASHMAALAYVDRQLPILLRALRRRGSAFCILCSDHGTAYGEDGYTGHRLAHPTVWTVPYAHTLLTPEPSEQLDQIS